MTVKLVQKSTPELDFYVTNNFFYNCRESSANRLYFLQNKPNLPEDEIDAKLVLTKNYEEKYFWAL